MKTSRLICPACRGAVTKVRIRESGSSYGCGKCGRWFSWEELGHAGASRREEPGRAEDGPRQGR